MSSNKKLNFDQLNEADLQIAQECKQLLMTKKAEMMSWKVFLQKTAVQLKKRILNDWITTFFEPVEQKLMETGTAIHTIKSQLEEDLKKQTKSNKDGQDFFNSIINQYISNMIKEMDKQIAATQAEINKKFDLYEQQNEKYLRNDGSGIFVYINKITGINLLPVIYK